MIILLLMPVWYQMLLNCWSTLVLWLRFSAVVMGVLGELVRWGFVLSESSATEIQPWAELWSVLFSRNKTRKTFSMSSKRSFFSVCLSSSVFVSPHSASLLYLPFPPKSVFHHQVEDVSKDILIFLPVDCTGSERLGFFFQRCTFRFYLWSVIIYVNLSFHLHHGHFPPV